MEQTISSEQYRDLFSATNREPKKKRGLGGEDKDQILFASMLRDIEAVGGLNCYDWWYDTSGEYRPGKTAGLLKRKGAKGGRTDYGFRMLAFVKNLTVAMYFYLEFKIEARRNQKNGGLSEGQIDFRESCKPAFNEIHGVAYNPKESADFLLQYKLIKDIPAVRRIIKMYVPCYTFDYTENIN